MVSPYQCVCYLNLLLSALFQNEMPLQVSIQDLVHPFRLAKLMHLFDRLCFGETGRLYRVYSYQWGCLAVRGNVAGIIVIGSYIYHLDVIVTSTQIYVNRIQICLTYYSPVYCIYKLVQLSQCSLDI